MVLKHLNLKISDMKKIVLLFKILLLNIHVFGHEFSGPVFKRIPEGTTVKKCSGLTQIILNDSIKVNNFNAVTFNSVKNYTNIKYSLLLVDTSLIDIDSIIMKDGLQQFGKLSTEKVIQLGNEILIDLSCFDDFNGFYDVETINKVKSIWKLFDIKIDVIPLNKKTYEIPSTVFVFPLRLLNNCDSLVSIFDTTSARIKLKSEYRKELKYILKNVLVQFKEINHGKSYSEKCHIKYVIWDKRTDFNKNELYKSFLIRRLKLDIDLVSFSFIESDRSEIWILFEKQF